MSWEYFPIRHYTFLSIILLSNVPRYSVLPLLPKKAILKPSQLRPRPDVSPAYVRRLPPNPRFDDRLNNSRLQSCTPSCASDSHGTLGYQDGDKRRCQAAPADQVSSGIQSQGGHDQSEHRGYEEVSNLPIRYLSCAGSNEDSQWLTIQFL